MLTEGTILNQRYQILCKLSEQGAMGLVYQATDLRLRGTVIVKQSRFSDEIFLRRTYPDLTEEELRSEGEFQRDAFEREALLLSVLRHNALPQVLDYLVEDDGTQSLVMEFIPGKNLGEMLAERLRQNQGPFPLGQVLDWTNQLLDVLNYLHTRYDRPIIHRDIKPENLKMMPDGQIVLLDFGLAKGTRPGLAPFLGSNPGKTAAYAPLEQHEPENDDGSNTDERSDLYSLAVTLYHLLTGKTPFSSVTRSKKIIYKMPDPLRPLHELNPAIPVAVSDVLHQAAALNQNERPASAAEMRELLRLAVTAVIRQPQPLSAATNNQTVVRPVRRPHRIFINLSDESVATGGSPIVSPKPETNRIISPFDRSFVEDLGKGVRLEMIVIIGGTFQMGSNEYGDEKPIHPVTLSPFHIGKYQVTQAQWQAVMRENPAHFKGDNLPVERVSWQTAFEFCLKLSEKTGKEYRLPTEAEWEYACRAGSTGKYCFGDDEALLEKYAWYRKNAGGKTHPVGEKRPNDWGLHDMHGNVWEWCQDWYDENYYQQSPKENPQGPSSGEYRVLRGGSWGNYLINCRSANRVRDAPGLINHNLGVRVVCVARTP